jgi:hypothetical protein
LLAKIRYPPQWLLNFRDKMKSIRETSEFMDRGWINYPEKCLTCDKPCTPQTFCSKIDLKCASCKDAQICSASWWDHEVYSNPSKSHELVTYARKTIETFAGHCRTVKSEKIVIDNDFHRRLFACSVPEGFQSAIRIGIENVRKWCPICEETMELNLFAYRTCCAYSTAKNDLFRDEVRAFKESPNQADYARAVHASNLYCRECAWHHGCFPSTPKSIQVCKDMLSASLHLPFEFAIALRKRLRIGHRVSILF